METEASVLGLLGIGLLGTSVLQRVRAAGFRVAGYDPNPERLRAAREFGLEAQESPRAVAAHSSIVLTCLPDGPSVRAALFDVKGNSILTPGSLLIDHTTCAPAESRSVAERLLVEGVEMLDAPISGGSRQVAEGKSLILVGGSDAGYRRGERVLHSIADRVRFLGPAGSGALGKLVTNLVLGLNRLVLAEGLAFAEAAGLEAGTALSLLRESAAYSRAMDVKGERMVEHRYDEPEARLQQHLKDVRLILELAENHEHPLPVSSLHARILERAVELGWGEVDNAAVLEVLRSESLE